MAVERLDHEVYFYLSEVRSRADLGSSSLLYIIQEVEVLVGYIAEILVGLCVGNPSWTSSSLFSVGYPMGPTSIDRSDGTPKRRGSSKSSFRSV
jgi:hypothetical protein